VRHPSGASFSVPAFFSPVEPQAASSPLPSGTPPSRWLTSCFESVEQQLALDEALLEETEDGLRQERTVRTWMADEFVVVVGSSSRLETEVNLVACRTAGVRVVRRPSGGATVVLGPGCLMWSVITPYPLGSPSVDTLHAAVLDPLCEALTADGIAIRRNGTSDLVIDDRKVSGNALRVRKRSVLYHGTLLDDFDIERAASLLNHPPREPSYRAGRPHASFLTNLNRGRARLEQLVQRAFTATGEASPADPERIRRLLHDRYRSAAWNERL
jgi:lipoate-protein ligase A